MAAEFEDTKHSPAVHSAAPEVPGGMGILSTLLLSVLLKLEDREVRVHARQLPRSTPEAVELPPPSKDETPGVLRLRQDVEDGNWGEQQTGDSLIDGDSLRSHQGEGALVSGTLLSPSSSTCLRFPDEDKDALQIATRRKEQGSDGLSQTGCGDTSRRPKSPYQDSAVDLIAEALLRALANVFVNGIVRRGYRAFGHIPLPICNEDWSVSTNVCNGNEDQGSTSDEDSQDLQTTEGFVFTQIEQRAKSDYLKTISTLPNWLEDVNKRIASSHITVHRADLVPPSVASSSCDLSRCSSVSVLSSVDRVLKVKTTHPVQSKLLWRMVRKAQDTSAASLEKLSEETTEGSTDESEGERFRKGLGPRDASSDLEAEKALLRASLLGSHEKIVYGGSCRESKKVEESVPCESPVLQKDSTARKEEKPCEQTKEHTETDDITFKAESTIDNLEPHSADEFPQPMITKTALPPATTPLLTDVVWRHASDSKLTDKEARPLSYSREGGKESKKARGVVKSALLHAVSSLVVNKVISGSVTSVSSVDSFELRCTPSFRKALADLPKASLHGFQWAPYQEEPPKGPCKSSRMGEDEIPDPRHQPQTIDAKKQSSESSDMYEDAMDKFVSSDDLRAEEVKDQIVSSDDVESIHEESYQTAPTFDKSIQDEQIERPRRGYNIAEDVEEILADPIELPLESIAFIKDKFEGAKVLAAVYRNLLYEPPSTGKTGTPTSPGTKAAKISRKVTSKAASGKHPKRTPSSDTDMPRSSTSSIPQKTTASPPWLDQDSIESVYKDPFNEAGKATPKPKPRPHKRPRKKSYASRKAKTRPPRKLRKRVEATPRTPPARTGVPQESKDKITPDGFLPAASGEQERENAEKTTPVERSEKSQENATSPRELEAEDISPEGKPKVKSYISFFEKLSRHKISPKNDSSTVSLPKQGDDADGRGRAETKHARVKLHPKRDGGGKPKDGQVGRTESAEEDVDNTPGRGIWANAAFFEALGKVQGPELETQRSPSRRTLKEGILFNENSDGRNVEKKQPQPGVEADDVTRSQPRRQTAARNRTSLEKRRSRNKNANNQMLLDQLLSSNSSGISNFPCRLGHDDKEESFTYALDEELSSEEDYELQEVKTVENLRSKKTQGNNKELSPDSVTMPGDQDSTSLGPAFIAKNSRSGSSVEEDEGFDLRSDLEKNKIIGSDVFSTADKPSDDESTDAASNGQEDPTSPAVRDRHSNEDEKESFSSLVDEPVIKKDALDQEESDLDQQTFSENEEDQEVDPCVESENAKDGSDFEMEQGVDLSLQRETKEDNTIGKDLSAMQSDEREAKQKDDPCFGPDKGENKSDLVQERLSIQGIREEEQTETADKSSEVEKGKEDSASDDDEARREMDPSRTPENSDSASSSDQEQLTKRGDECEAMQRANPSEELPNSEPLVTSSNDGTQPAHPEIRPVASFELELLDLMSSMAADNEETQHRFDIHDDGFRSPPGKDLDDICSLELLNDPLLASSPRPYKNLFEREVSSPNSDEAGAVFDSLVELAVSKQGRTKPRARRSLSSFYFRRLGGKPRDNANSLDIEGSKSSSNEDDLGELDAFIGCQDAEVELKTLTTLKDSTPKDSSADDRTATAEPYLQDEDQGYDNQPDTTRGETAHEAKDKKRRWKFKLPFRRKRSQKKAKTTTSRAQYAGKLQNQNMSVPDEEQQRSLDTAAEDRAVSMATETGTNGDADPPLSNSPSPPVCSHKRKFMLGRLKKKKQQKQGEV